jgi:hypothetical protein
MEKQLENSEKTKRAKQPSRPTKPARLLCLTGGPRLSAPTCSSLPFSLSLFGGVALSALRPVVCSRVRAAVPRAPLERVRH